MGYKTPKQAGRGGGRIDVVGNRPGWKQAFAPRMNFLSSEQASFCGLRSETDASRMVAEEGEEGRGGDGENEEIAGAGVIVDWPLCALALCLLLLCRGHVGTVFGSMPQSRRASTAGVYTSASVPCRLNRY